MKNLVLIAFLSLTGCASLADKVVNAYISGDTHGADLSKVVKKCVTNQNCQK